MRPRALIVEDDTATREVLRAMVEREGCSVDVAVDGEKAIGALARESYAVVILDIVLPKLSGTDVMEFLASTRPAQLETVIVVTGVEVGEIRKLFPGVCEALSKPVMPGRLQASLRRCLHVGETRTGISVA